ncbi:MULTISPECIES: metal/formaldehyde-sensitive transcriptional repressor [Acinetobacter]|uniref:metal/formaldehyde-sensitive transcriptional repressor n=1 Tax=Acinetobacter TaxID=469 RepID=UPI000C60ABB7|nr:MULTISPECIES: metal/formaldehyde-sensitive transcriptional repressor [unclassified Acinetobacter]MBC70353.1 transcriptional repressor RcnR to maintain nickel and cobalt homeostasis [Acinetobacter sp.]MBT50760.1 transcriptional repressor RcnR to maintain nickel and cobalt homeostasis [Acinetobacter sp.]|tara:strand:+ start:435 stop:704 length:270 start_codon:yes stop_codon:yes gene_type:complete
MSHLHQDKKIFNRIKRIQGQVASVEKSLLIPESSCLDVLQQVAAIKGAVNGLMQQLLEQHLREHVLKGEQNFDEEEMQKYLLLLDRYSK